MIDLTPAELADLKVKAKAATPGEWLARCINTEERAFAVISPHGDFGDQFIAGYLTEKDCNHIAAANPETILRLIDMVERRDEQIDTAHDALLAAQDALTNPGISAAIALQVIREALSATEPQT